MDLMQDGSRGGNQEEISGLGKILAISPVSKPRQKIQKVWGLCGGKEESNKIQFCMSKRTHVVDSLTLGF